MKARSDDPILRIRSLVPKIGSKRSDGLISRFRFCGETVGWSLILYCVHTIQFSEPTSIWHQNDHRNIMQNLSVPFILQEECRMKIELVLFLSGFFLEYRIRVSEGHFQCIHTTRFSEPTKIGSLKTQTNICNLKF